MRFEVCGGESYKGTVDSRCPGGRGQGFKTWWSREYMYIWEVLGRRRVSGRSLGGGEGMGGIWEEEREWEFFGRRRGSESYLGGEGVGGPWEEDRE